MAEENPVSDASELPYSLAGRHNPWLVGIVLSLATFMEVLDTSIANVALRHIAGSLAASIDESTWILTSYLVSNAVVLPISGWLSTVFGRKPFYMSCVAIFTISSLLCGLAPSLPVLIFCRVLQGIGGGGLAPSEQAILVDSFRPAQRGLAFALYGIAVIVAPVVGPTLGGWITDNYSWRWVFFINVPVGLTSLALVHFLLETPDAEKKQLEETRRRGFRVDYVGFGLVALGLGCLQIVLDLGQRYDWFDSSFILTFSAVSFLSLLLMVIWELSRDDPIVNLSLLKDRNFVSANVLMVAMGFVLFGTTQLLPQYVQEILGYTATQAGMVITPGGLAVMALMPIVGLALKIIQPRVLIGTGFSISALALFQMTGFTTSTNFEHIAWARVLQATSIGFLFIPISTASYTGLPPGKNNDASALLNLSRNLGGSFGISMVQTMLARRSQFHQSRLVEHLTPYDAAMQDMMRGISTFSGLTSESSLVALSHVLQQQVTMLAYIDVFHVLAWMSLCIVPVSFLLRKTAPGATATMH